MQNAIAELERIGQAAKAAARKLATLSSGVKDGALLNMAEGLLAKEANILAANKLDCDAAKAEGMDAAMLDRLLLTPARLRDAAEGVRTIAAFPDPLGESYDMRTLPNGLRLEKRRVPIGVVGAIYESRPNVTVDISALCLKSGNAVILRGGREALHSNAALVEVIQDGCRKAGVPQGTVQYVPSSERELVNHMLKMDKTIDLMIPRGGEEFVKFIIDNAAMPVIASGAGICHTYVDRVADIDKAVAIAYNAKVQRPTVCNALDALLVHAEIAERALRPIAKEWAKAGVEMHCDERSLEILKAVGDPSLKIRSATAEDWGKEFLALVAAIKVVDSLDEALDHIDRYSSKHSDAIVTDDYAAAMRFLAEVDSAVVYANASTRFTDGGQFGLGGEVGISTQKLHARGPLGLRELTTYKWTVMGNGQVRP